MRVVDMQRIHPHQDNSRFCSKCGERVGIYPSGQRALRVFPGMPIICAVCATKEHAANPDEPVAIEPAGPLAEIVQESRDSKDVNKA
jgi:hypothetical protein